MRKELVLYIESEEDLKKAYDYIEKVKKIFLVSNISGFVKMEIEPLKKKEEKVETIEVKIDKEVLKEYKRFLEEEKKLKPKTAQVYMYVVKSHIKGQEVPYKYKSAVTKFEEFLENYCVFCKKFRKDLTDHLIEEHRKEILDRIPKDEWISLSELSNRIKIKEKILSKVLIELFERGLIELNRTIKDVLVKRKTIKPNVDDFDLKKYLLTEKRTLEKTFRE